MDRPKPVPVDLDPRRPFDEDGRIALMTAANDCEELPRYGLTSVLFAFGVVGLLLPNVPLGRLATWLGALALWWAALLGLIRVWESGLRNVAAARRFSGSLRMMAAAHGMLWGALVPMAGPQVPGATALLAMVAAVTGGGALRLAGTAHASWLELIGAWAVVAVGLFGAAHPEAEALAVGGLVGVLFVGVHAARVRRIAQAGFRLRIRNQELLEELRGERRHTQDAWSRVKEQQRSLNVALSHAAESASRDDLTGVQNRRRFVEELGGAVAAAHAGGRPFALGLVTLDGFRAVSEAFGRVAADQCLVGVAGTLSAEVRGSDVVARVGDQAFGLLLRGLEDEDMAAVAQRMREACAELVVPGHPEISLSVSVVMVPGHAGRDSEELLLMADALLDEVVESGGAQARVHGEAVC